MNQRRVPILSVLLAMGLGLLLARCTFNPEEPCWTDSGQPNPDLQSGESCRNQHPELGCPPGTKPYTDEGFDACVNEVDGQLSRDDGRGTPGPSPTPSALPSATPAPSATPSATPSVAPSPSATPTASPTPSPAPGVPVPAQCDVQAGGVRRRVDGGSLQAAVDAAPAGSVLELASGNYAGDVTLNQRITLVSVSSRGAQIGGNVNVNGSSVCVLDLTVTAALMLNGSQALIQNNRVDQVVQVQGSDSTIVDNDVNALIFLTASSARNSVRNNRVGGCIPDQGTSNSRSGNTCQANPGTGCTSNPVPCND